MSAQATTRTQEAYLLHAACLLDMIAATFEQAYALAACGTSLEAILIDFDIQAAASTQHASITACARTVIKAAHNAATRRIPYDLALAVIMARARNYVFDPKRMPHKPKQ